MNKQKFLILFFLFFNIFSNQNSFLKIEGLLGEFSKELVYAIKGLEKRTKLFDFNCKIISAQNEQDFKLEQKLIQKKVEFCKKNQDIISGQDYIWKSIERNRFLFYGPPGNGKTTLVKKIAEIIGAELIHVSGASIVNKYVGSGAACIRTIFETAFNKSVTEKKVVLIFIDEVDVILSESSSEFRTEHDAATKELLTQLDQYKNNPYIIFAGATNEFDKLNAAFKDRMTYSFEIKNPTKEVRKEVLDYYFKKENFQFLELFKTKDCVRPELVEGYERKRKNLLEKIAKKTNGVSIRSLEQFVQKVTLFAEHEQLAEKSIMSLVPKPIEAKKEKKDITIGKIGFSFAAVSAAYYAILILKELKVPFFNLLSSLKPKIVKN